MFITVGGNFTSEIYNIVVARFVDSRGNVKIEIRFFYIFFCQSFFNRMSELLILVFVYGHNDYYMSIVVYIFKRTSKQIFNGFTEIYTSVNFIPGFKCGNFFVGWIVTFK